jgi:hypothetical protein
LPCRGPLRPPAPARTRSRWVPRGRRPYPPGAEGSAPSAGTHARPRWVRGPPFHPRKSARPGPLHRETNPPIRLPLQAVYGQRGSYRPCRAGRARAAAVLPDPPPPPRPRREGSSRRRRRRAASAPAPSPRCAEPGAPPSSAPLSPRSTLPQRRPGRGASPRRELVLAETGHRPPSTHIAPIHEQQVEVGVQAKRGPEAAPPRGPGPPAGVAAWAVRPHGGEVDEPGPTRRGPTPRG